VQQKTKNELLQVAHVAEKVFEIGTETAEAAEPVVDLLFPGISVLFNVCVAAAAKIEVQWQKTGKTQTIVSGQTPPKLADVVVLITPVLNKYAASKGRPPYSEKAITAAAQQALNFLDAVSENS
jgi:hypothetical protein